MPWERIRRRLEADWQPGEHVTIVGPTGSGKTHVAVALLDMVEYRLVLATKRQDPLVSSLQQHGYVITGDLSEIQWDGEHRRPLQRRVVFWPAFDDRVPQRDRLARQSAAMSQAMDWADKTGGWTVLVDETMWMQKRLGLEAELESMWFQGRTQGLSVLACSQRPSHVPRLAWTMPRYFFIFQTQDKTDLISLREISSGFPTELVEESVKGLNFERHECLFVDGRAREMAVTIAPPR